MSRNINDLRDKLFETLDALTREKDPMDVKRAQAISGIAAEIINTARVELQHQKQTGSLGTGFISDATARPGPGNGAANGQPPRLADLPPRRHRLQG